MSDATDVIGEPRARPAAEPDDLTRVWWDATREGQLLVQRCPACAHRQHYPRYLCVNCGATGLGWTQVRGRGTIYSFTVVRRSPDPAFEAPYTLALVRLEEGPVLLTELVDLDVLDDHEEELSCDLPVELAWRPLPDGRRLPVFRPIPLDPV